MYFDVQTSWKELGKKYPDAIFEICLEEWTYE